MTSTIRARDTFALRGGVLPALAGAGREVPVVADDPLLAEALSVALSSCGISARAAVSLPWRGTDGAHLSGAALVVLGETPAAAARRTVAALVADGRRVAVVGGARQQAALDECLSVGAEAVVSGTASLGDLATLLSELGREGPVVSKAGTESPVMAATVSVEVREAQRKVASLTRREQEILSALMAGRRASLIARRDFVSLHTVRTQIRSILRKLEVHSQVEAVAMAHRAAWMPVSGGH